MYLLDFVKLFVVEMRFFLLKCLHCSVSLILLRQGLVCLKVVVEVKV